MKPRSYALSSQLLYTLLSDPCIVILNFCLQLGENVLLAQRIGVRTRFRGRGGRVQELSAEELYFGVARACASRVGYSGIVIHEGKGSTHYTSSSDIWLKV